MNHSYSQDKELSSINLEKYNQPNIMKTIYSVSAMLALLAPIHAATVTTFYDFEGTGADRFDDPAGASADDLTGGQASAVFSSDTPGGFAGSQSISFDGSYTLSTSAFTNDLGPGANAFTVMFWVKAADLDQENNNTRLMSTVTDASGNPAWQVEGFGNDGSRGDRLNLRIQNKPSGFGNWFTPNATNALARSDQSETVVWRHVAIVNSNSGSASDGGAYAETFVDGVTVGVLDMDPQYDGFTIGNTAGRLTIGGPGPNDGSRDFTGLLDDVALFDGVVSDADILSIANGTLSPLAIPEPSSALMLILGGLLVGSRNRRRP